jgi:hypothetical protein
MKPFKTTASSIPGVVFSRIERSKRRSFWGPPGQWRWPVIILATISSAFFFAFLLGGCTLPGMTPTPTKTAEFLPISPEEDALIRMRLAMVLNQVKQQHYPALFDSWMRDPTAPPEAIAQQRRYFLHTHYCAERFLGKLKGYDQSSVRILKEAAPVKTVKINKEKGDTNDTERHVIHVRLVTSRDQAPEVDELYTLLQEELTYKFTGYFIKTRRTGFHDCMARIAYPKANVDVKPSTTASE